MSKITNVRLPNAATGEYNPEQFNQLVRSLEQIVFQLNNTYTPITSENSLAAISWFESRGGEEDVTGPTPVYPSGPAADAFGRTRVSPPFTLFDSQSRYQDSGNFDTSTSGGGSTTYDANASTTELDVGTASGDEVIRQTKRVFPYQPGKSLLVMNTFVFNAAKTNLRQRVGYFGAENGVYLEQDDDTVYLVMRTYTSGSAVDTRVAQSSWNGDTFDGNGASEITLDLTKSQILWQDFEWLGVGSVRCGFVINGQLIVAHTFHNANVNASVYMTTAILPIRYEITNTGTTASSSQMKQICSTVISEGGYQSRVNKNCARMTAETSVGTSFEPLVTIRLASDRLDAVVLPAGLPALPTGTSPADHEIALIRNATLTGASYNTTEFANVDYDTSATALSGGEILHVQYMSGTNQSASGIGTTFDYNFDLQLGRTIAGTSDTLTLAARVFTGNNDIIGTFEFFDLT